MTLLSTFVDTGIKLKSDKSRLLDQTWTSGVLPYFQNSGKVIQNIKKLKEAIDFHASSEKSWMAVLHNSMMKNILSLYSELSR
jgi:predicted lipoprotein